MERLSSSCHRVEPSPERESQVLDDRVVRFLEKTFQELVGSDGIYSRVLGDQKIEEGRNLMA